MKSLLLRVGIDTGSGGCLAPVFCDGTFEYVPIPEHGTTTEHRTYAELCARRGGVLAEYLPPRLESVVPHLDPEFDTFTYGDPTRTKRAQLTKLCTGDLLVFYAGLRPRNELDGPRVFIIGYFSVGAAHDFGRMRQGKKAAILRRVQNNAHAKRSAIPPELVIVAGDPEHSRLLRRAIPLGGAGDFMLRDLESITGYRGSLRRAVGHWVNEEHTPKLKAWLEDGIPSLVNDGSHLFSYVLASDSGFAPNVTGQYCTLACCKPRIRSVARVGDWIMGTLPKRLGAHRVGYVMRVNEALPFADYHRDARFASKHPSVHPDGDSIYYQDRNGRLAQVPNPHHDVSHLAHDTQVDRVLVGSVFWYFGHEAPELPSALRRAIVKRGPGHRRISDRGLVDGLVSWLSANYRIGIHGSPRDCHGGDPTSTTTARRARPCCG